jgi:predicted ATPase
VFDQRADIVACSTELAIRTMPWFIGASAECRTAADRCSAQRNLWAGERNGGFSAMSSARAPQRWAPTGHCTLLAVDIVSFGADHRTDDIRRYVRTALYDLIANSLAECAVAFESCYVDDCGDGLLVVLPQTTSAAALASTFVDSTRACLYRHNRMSSESAKIRLRVALHAGEVTSDDHGIVGSSIVHVSRLLDSGPVRQAVASPGAELALIVSDHLYQDVLRHAPGSVVPTDFHQVQVCVKETRRPAWVRVPGVPFVLKPAQTAPRGCSSFVGREEELAQLRDLTRAFRLITLVGVGGTGKTRLAVELMRCLATAEDPCCADGAYLVDLTAYQIGDDLVRALLTSLQVTTKTSYGPPERGPADDALVSAFLGRRVLVILDNCEHLVDDAAQFVDMLLTRTDGVLVVTTSREALHVDGEAVVPVPPLTVPPKDTSDLDAEYMATKLFVDRARAANPAFRLAPDNHADVADICRRLDGLPLAIELAAARVRALTPAQISALLAHWCRLPASGRRTTPRHQTLEAVVDWSYQLLDDQMRAVFSALSVFRGGFDLQMAQALGARLGIESVAMTDLVVRLVDKSLLQPEAGTDGAMRYSMLEVLRSYSRTRLTERDDADEVSLHHAHVNLDLAERQAAVIRGPGQASAIRILERNDDNLRAAFDFCCRNGHHDIALRMVDAMGWYLWMRGDRAFGWPGVVRALDIHPDAQDPLLRARALNWSCHLGMVGHRAVEPTARRHGRLAREILENLAGTRTADYAVCLTVGAFACHRENDYSESEAWIAAALRLSAELADPWLLGWSTVVAGITNTMRGRFEDGERWLRASIDHYRRCGEIWGLHRAELWLSRLLDNIGDLDGAVDAAEESLASVRPLGLGEAALAWLARLHILRHDTDAALEILNQVEAMRWWRSTPEAVAWMAECAALLAEQRIAAVEEHNRTEACRKAAALWATAADQLAVGGLTVYSIFALCRQIVQLARAGSPIQQMLASVQTAANGQFDLRAQALVQDARALVMESRRDREAALLTADHLWARSGVPRPPLFAEDIELTRSSESGRRVH